LIGSQSPAKGGSGSTSRQLEPHVLHLYQVSISPTFE
jgi:hypothetical protein